MKNNDPNQLHIFYDVVEVQETLKSIDRPVADYERVRDKLDAAAAKNQSLIRLQPGYAGSEWVIKQQTKNGAGGWRYVKKFATEKEAKDTYAVLLDSGEYVEG
ncbi:hypothetical protein [Spirosoma endbachense]|uniref:Uncharacterized protein n=1 Tax=Spirosoma endbachense TaxID=2666025 RepID=A0A6P1VT58_9BACT|nr:hypothetical protein [Spirosoma endbachense]QHV96273.1 hypothetical protein GJR95_15170 [Spirosoma endbachense]